MHTILLYPNGRRADGIILSATQELMRVVLKQSADTVELRRLNGVWTSEEGSRIEFEFMMISATAGLHGDGDFKAKPLTLTAGGQAFLPV